MFAVDIVAQDLVHSWTLGSCPDINRGLAYAHTRVDTVKGTSALVELFFKNSRMVEAGRQAGSSIPDRPPLFFAPLFDQGGKKKKRKGKSREYIEDTFYIPSRISQSWKEQRIYLRGFAIEGGEKIYLYEERREKYIIVPIFASLMQFKILFVGFY